MIDLKNYANQWVAIRDEKVIASASELGEMLLVKIDLEGSRVLFVPTSGKYDETIEAPIAQTTPQFVKRRRGRPKKS